VWSMSGSASPSAFTADTGSPMNKATIRSLVISNRTLNLDNQFGYTSFEDGIAAVEIVYLSRNMNIDANANDRDTMETLAAIEGYKEMERNIEGAIDMNRIPFGSVYSLMRKNTKNNIVFADTFRFANQQEPSINLARWTVFTTNDFFISVNFEAAGNIGAEWYKEAPDYFTRADKGVILDWSTMATYSFNDDLVAKDILNRRHPSKTVMQWYDETEKILNSLRLQ